MQTSFFISSRFSEKAKEDKTMKFLHCADIHLDSPFSLALPADAGKRRTELRSDFSSAVLYAKTEGCKLFLIAGDLFDDDFVTKDTMEMLVHEFSAFPSCQFVISPGNHDPFCERSPYKLTEWPENVHIFESPEMGYFDIPESDVRVWGYAFTSDTLTSPPLAGFHIPEDSDGKINILLAHADLGAPLSPYAPLSEKELEKSGFAYAALGHIHKASGIQYAGKTPYAYPGCIEGRGFDETGYKGALVGELTKETFELRAVRFCKRRYEICTAEITGATSLAGLADKLVKLCGEYGNDTALRLVLEGVTPPDFAVDPTAIRTLLPNPYELEIKDNTLPLYGAEILKKEGTLVGAFYRKLEPAITSEDPSERETAILALKYGLKALNGRDL